MRILVLASVLAAGCGPHVTNPARSTTPAVASRASDGCTVRPRQVSPPGRAGVHPHLAAADGVFAVVWEDSDDHHRGVHFQSLDAQANPVGPSVEVADLDRGGAEPRVVADGDGFAVVWTVDQADTSMIVLRRVDARGKPRGDVMPVVSVPNARALSAIKVDDGFAVAWWTWSANPPEQLLSWLDGSGKPVGKPLSLSKGSLVEPQVDLEPVAGGVRAVWVEQVANTDHIFAADVTRAGVRQRVDLGAGSGPSFGKSGVIYANLGDGTVWRSPVAAAHPTKLSDGQSPEAAADQVCLFRTVSTLDLTIDELRCVGLDGDRIARDQRIAGAPGGVLTLHAAAGAGAVGIVYQTEGDDLMSVQFAALSCANASAPTGVATSAPTGVVKR